MPEHGAPEPLRAYDTVVVRGPATFTFVDELDTAAEPIACGEFCAAPEQGGTRHRLGWSDGGETSSPRATTLIVGAYPVRGEISRRLLDALPVVLRVRGRGHRRRRCWTTSPPRSPSTPPASRWCWTGCWTGCWSARCAPGSTGPTASRRPGGPPSATRWSATRCDCLHADPAAPWTVSSLAARIGVSRSTLAKRFADLVGEPPLTYLTRWRMTLAADLLVEQKTETVADVARAVGYSDPFGFSAAFKRVRGVNPSEFRRTAIAAVDRQIPAVATSVGSGTVHQAQSTRDA